MISYIYAIPFNFISVLNHQSSFLYIPFVSFETRCNYWSFCSIEIYFLTFWEGIYFSIYLLLYCQLPHYLFSTLVFTKIIMFLLIGTFNLIFLNAVILILNAFYQNKNWFVFVNKPCLLSISIGNQYEGLHQMETFVIISLCFRPHCDAFYFLLNI